MSLWTTPIAEADYSFLGDWDSSTFAPIRDYEPDEETEELLRAFRTPVTLETLLTPVS